MDLIIIGSDDNNESHHIININNINNAIDGIPNNNNNNNNNNAIDGISNNDSNHSNAINGIPNSSSNDIHLTPSIDEPGGQHQSPSSERHAQDDEGADLDLPSPSGVDLPLQASWSEVRQLREAARAPGIRQSEPPSYSFQGLLRSHLTRAAEANHPALSRDSVAAGEVSASTYYHTTVPPRFNSHETAMTSQNLMGSASARGRQLLLERFYPDAARQDWDKQGVAHARLLEHCFLLRMQMDQRADHSSDEQLLEWRCSGEAPNLHVYDPARPTPREATELMVFRGPVPDFTLWQLR